MKMPNGHYLSENYPQTISDVVSSGYKKDKEGIKGIDLFRRDGMTICLGIEKTKELYLNGNFKEYYKLKSLVGKTCIPIKNK